ncbi:MAG: esterase-like activity of phytase family protein [Prevotella sp.]|nr:esterase-like activity of phytase family protein [Prevotella sp.]
MSWFTRLNGLTARWTALLCCVCLPGWAQAQMDAHVHKQRSFAKTVPPGDYSGLSWLGGNEYAVVCDKTDDAWLRFHIDIDSLTGKINDVEYVGKTTLGAKRRDPEDVVFVPQDSSLFICCESDNEVWEYRLDGSCTGRKLQVPEVFEKARGNCGLEALAYHPQSRRFWVINESTIMGDGDQPTAMNGVAGRLRLQAFDADMTAREQYLYVMEKAVSDKPAIIFAMGVSALTALPDGRLLVLEREFHVPKGKLGAYAQCKIFLVDPRTATPIGTERQLENAVPMEKTMVCEWRTTLTLLNHAIANYEGMCLGPTLSDGRWVIVLLSDSQHQYAGVLKDWFRTIVIKP